MKSHHRAVLAVAASFAFAAPLRAEDVPLGATEPSEQEQLLIYTLNRARHDPVKYGTEIGFDLSGVAPQQPLALNLNLTGSARFHAADMLAKNYFAHVSPDTGKSANFWAVQNGYDLFGNGLGFVWANQNFIESIAVGFNSFKTYPEALASLIIDKGIDPPGHRIHLMATSAGFQQHNEIGAGRAVGPQTTQGHNFTAYYHAIHSGYVSTTNRFLTGVVFDDANGNGSYDAGEGLGGVTVDAGAGGSTQSFAEGGWSIQVAPGAYTVTCSGGPFTGTATANVTVSAANREIDFRSGLPKGEIDFAGAAIPNVSISASVTRGAAPLTVNFTGTTDGPSTEFAWEFGDMGLAAGAAVQHKYNTPGVFLVRLRGTDVGGVGTAITTICVEGPSGAGAGTTPPASAALTPSVCGIVRNFAKPGKDSISFTGTVELPAGWTPGLSPVTVVIAGAKVAFPLVAGSDKLVLEGGSSFKLTYKKAKGGAPLGAGVVAKVVVKLKGDLAAVLGDLGVRNETGARTLNAVRFVVSLGQTCWEGTAAFSLKAKRDVKATGAILKP